MLERRIKNMERTIVLHNGVKMPIIGFGTWLAWILLCKGKSLSDALDIALETGYRHIDTAYVYENEDVVGDAVQRFLNSGKAKREDLFIVTKLFGGFHRGDEVEPALRESLKKLKLNYVDLYLIHTPMSFKKSDKELVKLVDDHIIPDPVDHLETWKAMEEVYKKGLTRAIGLSNFNIEQMQRIIDNCEIIPHNIQVECHIYWPQNELFDFCQKYNISFTAYGPIGSPGRKESRLGVLGVADINKEPAPLEDALVKSIAEMHKKTPAQILLKYLIQRGMIVIPKSTNEGRIKENFNVFDFKLEESDMSALANRPIKKRLFNFYWARKHPDFPFEPMD
ncbi:1,5-anhydro-D-fructose reductase [Trichinella britovi]|uniref:1,5-anhydro-D-fructose reductase n=2 Tax=Trichinella britovi TaxID=45882 RepID=A0A0V1C9F7_TRIBR|nr:1,5-anhydro-D-fructose reductase [Trichinella britovi]